MLKFDKLDHYDDFGDTIVCWVDVKDVPKTFSDAARKECNGKYEGFGVCMSYDFDSKSFFVVEDFAVEIVSQSGHNQLFCVDENGEKHWFPYRLSSEEIESFSSCLREQLSLV